MGLFRGRGLHEELISERGNDCALPEGGTEVRKSMIYRWEAVVIYAVTVTVCNIGRCEGCEVM